MNKKGFANIVPIIILFVVFTGTAGYFVLNNRLGIPTPRPFVDEQPAPTPASIPAQTFSQTLKDTSPSTGSAPSVSTNSATNATSTPASLKTSEIEEIRTLLKKEAWVRVIVVLSGNEFTSPKFQEDLNKKKSEIQKIQNAVLADLTENDFKIIWKLENSLIFTGEISKSGMEKLGKDSRVKSISLDREVHAM